MLNSHCLSKGILSQAGIRHYKAHIQLKLSYAVSLWDSVDEHRKDFCQGCSNGRFFQGGKKDFSCRGNRGEISFHQLEATLKEKHFHTNKLLQQDHL